MIIFVFNDHNHHEYNFSPFQWMLLLLLLLVSESVGTVVMLLYREPALHLIQVMFYFHSCFCSGYGWCDHFAGVPSRPTEDRVWREQRLHNGLTLCTTKGLVMLEISTNFVKHLIWWYFQFSCCGVLGPADFISSQVGIVTNFLDNSPQKTVMKHFSGHHLDW